MPALLHRELRAWLALQGLRKGRLTNVHLHGLNSVHQSATK